MLLKSAEVPRPFSLLCPSSVISTQIFQIFRSFFCFFLSKISIVCCPLSSVTRRNIFQNKNPTKKIETKNIYCSGVSCFAIAVGDSISALSRGDAINFDVEKSKSSRDDCAFFVSLAKFIEWDGSNIQRWIGKMGIKCNYRRKTREKENQIARIQTKMPSLLSNLDSKHASGKLVVDNTRSNVPSN